MSYSFEKPQGSKEEIYQVIHKQIEALVEGECDLIANMANVAAILHNSFDFWWTGFYRVLPKSSQNGQVVEDELVLGPFQGPVACMHIGYGKGVCGSSWKEKRTLLVSDVELFPGHIACSSLSKSEVVVPIFRGEEVIAVLDIDSDKLATFDQTDKYWLEKIVKLL